MRVAPPHFSHLKVWLCSKDPVQIFHASASEVWVLLSVVSWGVEESGSCDSQGVFGWNPWPGRLGSHLCYTHSQYWAVVTASAPPHSGSDTETSLHEPFIFTQSLSGKNIKYIHHKSQGIRVDRSAHHRQCKNPTGEQSPKTHGWDWLNVWILKGENSYSKCISTPFLWLFENMNTESQL